MVIKIQLTKGYTASADESDAGFLGLYSWHAKVCRDSRYIYAACSAGFMHRMLFQLRDRKVFVNHINHDTLDNRRCNLRICTPTQNQQNRAERRVRKCKYKGIVWNRGSYIAQIGINGVNTYLGRFKNAEDAARAYDRAAREHFGEFASLNFSEDIQCVA